MRTRPRNADEARNRWVRTKRNTPDYFEAWDDLYLAVVGPWPDDGVPLPDRDA